MLVIRMQRTGRKGHAQFRVVVQDSRRTPTSGRVVASLGSYDPHSKQTTLNKEKAQFYLDHGAQPSERVTRLLQAEGVKLPKWITLSDKKAGKLRNPEKLRRNRPVEEAAPPKPAAEEPQVEAEASEAQTDAAESATEAPAEEAGEATEAVETDETPAK